MRHSVLATFLATTTAGVLTLAATPVAPSSTPGPEPEPGAAGVTSGPVEYVGTLPLDAGNGFGSTVHEDLYIVTGPSKLTIYDTSRLTAGMPTPIATHPLPGVAFNEEPRTDGTRLLLHDDVRSLLYLFDISDPTAPELVTTFPTKGAGHMWACVFEDCSIVYGSYGMILDLTDMADPVVLGNWTRTPGVAVENFHAIDEVAPGIVMTGTEPLYLLDARQDPANPTVIASGRMDDPGMIQAQLPVPGNTPRYYAARVEWPARTTPLAPDEVDPTALLPQHERWGIVTVETPFAADCAEGSGGLLTYDMDRVEEDGTFTVVDDFRITGSGTYLDGYAPLHTIGCFAYAFSQHPDHTATRLVSVAWTEHGMRLFTVDESDGGIDEVGSFVGYGGWAADAEWIAEDLVAITDLHRGVDIVRVDLDDL